MDFFPFFQKKKICVHQEQIQIPIFARSHENAKTMEIRLHSLQAMRCVIYNVVEFETSVFDRRYENDKQAFFKNDLHAGGRFWKDALSMTVFTQYVWTVDQTGGEKNMINSGFWEIAHLSLP